MDRKEELVKLGFSYFAGKTLFDDGKKILTILDLKTEIDAGYSSLDIWLDKICDLVKNKRKIIVSQSPGISEPVMSNLGNLEDAILTHYKSQGIEIPKEFSERAKTHKKEVSEIKERIYIPLSESEIEELKILYNASPNKSIIDPFTRSPVQYIY